MIIEGLMTSTAENGGPHVAPMGPVVDSQLETWILRPFQSSTTFANLKRTGRGVFHVVDDVLPLVQAALDMPVDLQFQALNNGSWIIPSACHWYSLKLLDWNVSQPRAEVKAVVESSAIIRPFWGWNRAKHAIIEATISATRLHLTGRDALASDLCKWSETVSKTAGTREQQAWDLVLEYIQNWKS